MIPLRQKSVQVRQVPVSEHFHPELDATLCPEERDERAAEAVRDLTGLPAGLREAARDYFAALDASERADRHAADAAARADLARAAFTREMYRLEPKAPVGGLILFLEAGYGANIHPITGLVHVHRLYVPAPTGHQLRMEVLDAAQA